jgi:hypothetical protein
MQYALSACLMDKVATKQLAASECCPSCVQLRPYAPSVLSLFLLPAGFVAGALMACDACDGPTCTAHTGETLL